jgi:rsbT antagonist protein RsbS
VNSGPALVSILRQGDTLVASVHTALDDSQMVRFQEDLVRQIGEYRARGVIIDVAALDVIDSFASRTFRALAEMARLRGAVTVIVGIQPDVAMAMVRLGMGMGGVATALDLEEGLGYLEQVEGVPYRPTLELASMNQLGDLPRERHKAHPGHRLGARPR